MKPISTSQPHGASPTQDTTIEGDAVDEGAPGHAVPLSAAPSRPAGRDEDNVARALIAVTTGALLLAAGALSLTLVDIGQAATGLAVALIAGGMFITAFGFRLARRAFRCATNYGREVAIAQRDAGRERVVVENR